MSYLLDPANWHLSDNESIPRLLLQHLSMTGISLFIGLLIAFPIALLVTRYRPLYLPTITTAGLIYTIPSLSACSLLLPYTGLDQTTMIIPLIGYAQIVLIRNIVAAIRAVDPLLIEVGRAMGMSNLQLQVRVVLPLALPVIIAGIRIVTVTTIGIATIGSLIGAGGLGDLIFSAIQLGPKHYSQVIAGAILVSGLAITADLLLLAVERAISRGNTPRLAN